MLILFIFYLFWENLYAAHYVANYMPLYPYSFNRNMPLTSECFMHAVVGRIKRNPVTLLKSAREIETIKQHLNHFAFVGHSLEQHLLPCPNLCVSWSISSCRSSIWLGFFPLGIVKVEMKNQKV